MATAENVKTITGLAGTAISIYRFVSLAADGQFDHVGSADARADAVSAEAQSVVGDPVAIAPVAQPAVMLVEASAAITRGDLVASSATGKAKTAAAAGAATYVQGIALDAATADGEIIRVLLNPFKNAAS